MVGANYTGGRRNAAKARSKDTTGRLQRGHFSKQRLGILTDALRSRRLDHQSPCRSRPSAVADNSNPTSISWSGYSTCTPAATIFDISLGHAKRDLAQKHRQSTQQDFHLHRNDGGPFSPSLRSRQPCLDPSVRNDLPPVTSAESSTSVALTGNGNPDPASSLQTLLLETPSAAKPSCATSASASHPLPQPSSHSEPTLPRASLPENQPTPVTEVSSKRRSKILDLIDISDRKPPYAFILFLFRIPRFAVSDTSSHESQSASLFIIYHLAHCPPYTPPRAFILASSIPNLFPSLITALVIILLPQN